VAAAVTAGADMIGFNLVARSPRFISLAQAANLAGALGPKTRAVMLMVDPDDELVAQAAAAVPGAMLQLHGGETPARVAEIKARTGREIIKAAGIAGPEDIAAARSFAKVADWLLLDAKPPKTPQALPGGNGITFDWGLVTGQDWERPWLLSGGLTPQTVARAIAAARPTGVDVSSGVETAPGKKDSALIAAFTAAAKAATGPSV